MTTITEALRLAECLTRGDSGYSGQAAAELRRLHEENGRLRIVAEMSTLLLDQRSALLEALKMIAGAAPCIDNLMSDKDIARAAIKAVEGEQA